MKLEIILPFFTTGVFAIFVAVFIVDCVKNRLDVADTSVKKTPGLIIGFLFNGFFDSLGIGSFATMTTCFNYTKYVKEVKYYPGTLNIGSAFAAFTQAMIFMTIFEVDPALIFSCLATGMLGGIVGGFASSKTEGSVLKKIIGCSLLVISTIMILKNFNIIQSLATTNTATSLHGVKFLIVVGCAFIFAFLGAFAVGAYALYIMLCSFLGLSPLVAWPIMSVVTCCRTCVSSITFIKFKRYKRRQAIFLAIGGVLGSIIASVVLQIINASKGVEILAIIAAVVVFVTGINMTFGKLIKRFLAKK